MAISLHKGGPGSGPQPGQSHKEVGESLQQHATRIDQRAKVRNGIRTRADRSSPFNTQTQAGHTVNFGRHGDAKQFMRQAGAAHPEHNFSLQRFGGGNTVRITPKNVSKGQPSAFSVHVPTAGTEIHEEPPKKPIPGTPKPIPLFTPQVYNDGVGIIKAALGIQNDGGGDSYDVQEMVSGIDWELANSTTDMDLAAEIATSNLLSDSNYYRRKRMMMEGTSDDLAKSAGYSLDLGSSNCRESGYIGLDLFPHDYATMVHDLSLGIPAEDGSVNKVRAVNSIHKMDAVDPKALMSEIQRVLMPEGEFYYEGPDDIWNYQDFQDEYPGMVLVDHEDNAEQIEKEGGEPTYRQKFTRIAVPDPATADDAEPRTGISQYDELPADALLAMDALGYYEADESSSGRGNRIHGYPSQGALVTQKRRSQQDDEDDGDGDEEEFEKSHDVGNIDRLKALSQLFAELFSSFIDEEAEEDEEAHGNVGKSAGRRVASVAVKHGNHLLMGKRRDNQKWTVPGGHVDPGEDMHSGALRELKEEAGIDADKLDELTPLNNLVDKEGKPLDVQCFKLDLSEKPSTSMLEDPDGEVYRWQWVNVEDGLPDHIRTNLHVPAERNTMMKALGLLGEKTEKAWARIGKKLDGKVCDIKKADRYRQVVYCVVLSPDEVDAQDDWMTEDDIMDAAHQYLAKSRVIGADHNRPIDALPVESYVAPQDLHWDEGPFGPQEVKRGSWILGIKVHDPKEWNKVMNGDYQGVSVGGMGLRE